MFQDLRGGMGWAALDQGSPRGLGLLKKRILAPRPSITIDSTEARGGLRSNPEGCCHEPLLLANNCQCVSLLSVAPALFPVPTETNSHSIILPYGISAIILMQIKGLVKANSLPAYTERH